MSTTRNNRWSAWLVVGLGFLALALAFSARAALGLVMPIWERELGWTRGFVSLGVALAMLVMAGVAPFAGNLVDRRGPRALLAGGLAAIGLGMLLVAVAQSRWMFLLAFSLIAAVGFGIVATHVVATAIAARFRQGGGLATGIGTAGATAGQLVIVPLLAILLASGSWRWSFAALGIGCIGLGLAVLALLDPPGATATAAARPTDPLGERLRSLARSGPFHALFWSFAICGFTTSGVIETHLLPYAALCGFPPLASAAAYGVLSGVNLAGMIAAGWLADRVDRPLLLGAIYAARGLCFVLLLFIAGDLRLLLLFAVLFGAFDYSTVPVTASLVADRLGLGIMGLAMGLISAGHSLGAAAGAFFAGWLFDRTGAYDGVWLASLGLALLAALLVLTMRDGSRVSRAVAEPAAR